MKAVSKSNGDSPNRKDGLLTFGLMVAGGILLTIGAAQCYRPAGWIVAGILLLVAARNLARTKPRFLK